MVSSRRFSLTLLTAVTLAGMGGGWAHGAATEPNGLSVPQPLPSTEGTQAAAVNSEVRVDRLIVARGEALDSVLDGFPTAAFSPLCNLTAQLVLRGGTCEVDLGWYNVPAADAAPPSADQIYSLLAANNPMSMPRPDYTPGVGGTPGPVATLEKIRVDPRYLGGLIGFAMMGNDQKAPAVCTQTHFTDAALNPVCTAPACAGIPEKDRHWITALTYPSTVLPDAAYLAFEERPVSATDFGNDGDFNDQLFLVTGVTCPGGGQPCDTGMKGVCQRGTQQCGKQGKLTCVAAVKPSADVCDGQDNDCDGVVDSGLPCAEPGQVCDRGVCVNACHPVSAPCPAGLTCDAGVCREPRCVNVACPAGQLCVAGVCGDGCTTNDQVHCPHGQTCRAGRCVDPCAGVSCAAGLNCEDGACVAPCSCRSCPAGKACTRDGVCVDLGCEKTACPAPMICVGGLCTDPCHSTKESTAICPSLEFCSMGTCVPRNLGGTGTGGGGGDLGPPEPPRDGGAADLAEDAPDGPMGISGCSCGVVASPTASLALASLALAAVLLGRRRR